MNEEQRGLIRRGEQNAIAQSTRNAREAQQLNSDLLTACQDLHALLWHYDLARQPNGVDWGDPDEIRREWIARLEALFLKAGVAQ